MEKAIKKAIEGGYMKGLGVLDMNDNLRPTSNPELLFLDPLFWQALGKAEGWGDKEVCSLCGKNCFATEKKFHYLEKWEKPSLYHWHRFVDHIDGKKDAEEFFFNLLK